MKMTFKNTLGWYWIYCGFYFIHNFPPPPSHLRIITSTIHPKMRQDNANKRWTSEKYQLLLLNALEFFLMREKDLKLGIRYLQCLFCRGDRLLSRLKGPPRHPKSTGTCKNQKVFRIPLNAEIRSQTQRKTREKRMRAIQRFDVSITLV